MTQEEIMKELEALGQKTKDLTPEERAEALKKGGKSRRSNLTPAERERKKKLLKLIRKKAARKEDPAYVVEDQNDPDGKYDRP